MTEEHPQMVGAATVFVVSDIMRSIEHYRDALGFKVTFQYGNPTFYACLCRDEVALHLLAAHRTHRLPGNGGICLFVRDVDAVYGSLLCAGQRWSDCRATKRRWQTAAEMVVMAAEDCGPVMYAHRCATCAPRGAGRVVANLIVATGRGGK